jgi:DNA-binding LacI/PurR family transcriptional regulator
MDAAGGAASELKTTSRAIQGLGDRLPGLSVPRDFSVVGYNDIPDAVRSDPPLTTVDGMGVQKGRAAARIVFGGGPPHREILKPNLIMRASTGPAPRI